MSSINVVNDSFTCHQVDDMAVITVLEEAQLLSTTVGGKEQILNLVETISDSDQIHGLVVLYSNKYKGDAEYKEFLLNSIKAKNLQSEARYSVTYKNAITQFLENINAYPKPIVCGLSGDIGPDSFAVSLAFDMRIATDITNFVHPNLQMGFPPSPPLTFYLVHSLGYTKAMELILTKPTFSAQEALELGLINQIAPLEELEDACINMLRRLMVIPGQTIAESRRMLQPDIDEAKKFIDTGFKESLKLFHKLNI